MQVLKERDVGFSNTTCARRKYIAEEKKVRDNAYKAYKADMHNMERVMEVMSLQSGELVAYHAQYNINCNCCLCVLNAQDDFRLQPSALEELVSNFNKERSTNHRIIPLPKFHPELNPIERCWSIMKFYCNKHSDGKLATLKTNMREGLSIENLPISLIRKYVRLSMAYCIAYDNGLDIVQAEDHIRQHRSHRRAGKTMDSILNELYYPITNTNGEEEKEEEEEEDIYDELDDIRYDVALADKEQTIEDNEDVGNRNIEDDDEVDNNNDDLIVRQHLFGGAFKDHEEEEQDLLEHD
jgi:hypothetical protein